MSNQIPEDREGCKPVDASSTCPTCKGRGIIETGEMENGPGGIGFASVPCSDCDGTGEIFAFDHDRFQFQFGTDVVISGQPSVVFFDYEGDDIFVWWIPGDTRTDGENLSDTERDSVYQQLYDWYRDYTAPRPEDYL